MKGHNKFVFVAPEAAISPEYRAAVTSKASEWGRNAAEPSESQQAENWIVENVELVFATPVIGRLRDGLAFWKDTEAGKWVLDVPRDGMGIITEAFLKNENLYAMKWLSCLHLVLCHR